jgi:AcrR family transcriptional regulator
MEADEPRSRRLTRAEAKARTRALLLAAAGQVFAQKGFAGASVDDIAQRAGFTTGALYAHFGSKDELFVELLRTRSGLRLSEAVAIVSEPHESVGATRSALARLLLDVADEDRDMAPLQAEFWLYAIRRPEFREPLAAQFRAHRDELAGALAGRPGKRNDREDVDFGAVATVLLALFQGLVQLRRADPALVPEDLYDTAIRWLFKGMKADEERT